LSLSILMLTTREKAASLWSISLYRKDDMIQQEVAKAKTFSINVRPISPELHTKLMQMRAETGRSIRDSVVMMVEEWFRIHEGSAWTIPNVPDDLARAVEAYAKMTGWSKEHQILHDLAEMYSTKEPE
jgi:hypothetical protein